jgi:ABC-type polysaccharide/polyol phosphate export permease
MQLSIAVKDFWNGLKAYRIWGCFAWMEVKQRYRRSILGPWWISLSMLIFVIAMGIVYSHLFKENLATYLPFFASGFLFWTLISTSITESTEVFKLNRQFIKQINLPYSLYIFKHLSRQLIFLVHNFAVYILIMLYFKISPNLNMLLVIPGLVLLLLNLYWISLFLCILGTRFRDIVPIVTSCMQIALFITPVTWMPKLVGPHSYIIKLNPLTYLIEVVRTPLLGINPLFRFWWTNCVMIILGFTFTFIVLSYCRNKIAFWVD